jgi:hypothetical protein
VALRDPNNLWLLVSFSVNSSGGLPLQCRTY